MVIDGMFEDAEVNNPDPMPLATVISDLREFLLLVLVAAAKSSRHDMAWRAGLGWRKNE